MPESLPISIARQWFDAFNEHSLEKLLSLYHDKAQHYSPKLKAHNPKTEGIIVGKDALRAWWKDSFDRLPSLKYIPQRFIADHCAVFMEYSRYVEGEEVLLVGETLEIKEQLIIASRVFHG